MSAQAFEIVLARLYTELEFRETFFRDPDLALEKYDLTSDEVKALKAIDRTGLLMAAHSFGHKRAIRVGSHSGAKAE